MRRFVCLVAVILGCGLMGTGIYAQSFLTHHVRDAVNNGAAQANGRLSENQAMSLNIVLPLRDPAGLETFLSDVYNPSSANYRHFLTPQEFAATFGPSQQDYDGVVEFAQQHGFAVTGGSFAARDVQVQGPVSAVESAFHVTMRTYRHPTENRTFYSADREPTTDLPFALWHVSGLDNYSLPHPLVVSKTAYAAAMGVDASQVVSHATTGSGPSASFLGSDMRAAYYGGGSLTGAGQNLGLLEYEGTDLADLQTYYKNVGQTYPGSIITLLSTDGTSVNCVDTRGGGNCDDTEQTLDMTQALGMAPGLKSLVVYVGSSDTAIIGAMVTHSPLPTTIGCSWGWTPADASTLNPYFEQMEAQGQTFFAASGDASTWTKTGRSAAWPADNAYVVSVGGTDLITAGAKGPWASETAWVDSGGGISPDSIAIPSWQQISGVINSSNKGSTTLRNGPDVAANANFTFYTCADQKACLANEYGGTSFAAPMWAGYVALVNEQLDPNNVNHVGFINPTIYPQNVTSSYATDFHDVTSGTSGSHSAVTGYDLVTGWGSPNGVGLINALTGSGTQTPGFAVSASPGSVSVLQGSSGNSTISLTNFGGFSSAVGLSASGAPSGVTVGFSPGSISASQTSTAMFTVASTAATGTYTITITGTSGGQQETTTVSLTVTSPVSNYTISASPSSLSVTRGSSSSATVTLSGTVTGAVSFSASGMESGETVTFAPSSLSAAGTTTMKVSASSSAATGTGTIRITASGGGSSAQTTVSVRIRR